MINTDFVSAQTSSQGGADAAAQAREGKDLTQIYKTSLEPILESTSKNLGIQDLKSLSRVSKEFNHTFFTQERRDEANTKLDALIDQLNQIPENEKPEEIRNGDRRFLMDHVEQFLEAREKLLAWQQIAKAHSSKEAANFSMPTTLNAYLEKASNFEKWIDQPDDQGSTMLERAFHLGRPEQARLLLKNGASVDQKGENGRTLLDAAVTRFDQAFVRLLLENGADANQKTKEGRTLLHTAFLHKNEGIVRLLLENGAEPN